jgi:ribosome-binding factor A
MSSRRQSRVNDLIREELSELIRREVRDPRLAEITSITEVAVSPDMLSARVYVSVLGDEEQKKQTIEGLQAAAVFLHHRLKDRLVMRYIPKLTFERDDSIEEGARLLSLMKEEAAHIGSPAKGRRRK